MKTYDLAIIGAGPAGLSATIYAARYKINFITIGHVGGGAMAEAHKVENYPGVKSTSGQNLVKEMKEQAEGLGAEIVDDGVRVIAKEKELYKISGNNDEWSAKNILFATGTERRKLAIPGEKEYSGKGVSYCATCDGFFFKEKTVAVIGGGDSAATAALYLADITKKVYLVYRGEKLKAEPAWIEKINKEESIEVIYNESPKEIKGENIVNKLILDDKEIDVDGVFIEIGSTPASAILSSLGVKCDDGGYVKVDETQMTNVDSIYAAGDITTGSNKLKQIVSSAAEGAVATNSIFKKVKKS